MTYQDDTFLADKYVNSHYFFAGYQIEMWREVACFISCENSKGKVFIFASGFLYLLLTSLRFILLVGFMAQTHKPWAINLSRKNKLP